MINLSTNDIKNNSKVHQSLMIPRTPKEAVGGDSLVCCDVYLISLRSRETEGELIPQSTVRKDSNQETLMRFFCFFSVTKSSSS
jgi:hypothetical protein